MKQNPLIQKAVEQTVKRMIDKGELLTPRQANDLALQNLHIQTQLMTIAVNRACGIGKTRFERDVQPVLEELYAQWKDDQKTVDLEYANYQVERLFNSIMDGDANGKETA
ncbi:MAG: hypothetical protein IJX67_10855 [Oscillospiraceae bacterium]|nr:hypothetical protein [Oscillospiraceae bacterium]